MALLAAVAFAASSRASGCTITWVGDVDGNWHGSDGPSDTNWDDDTLPGAGDHVCLNTLGAPYSVTLGANATVDHYTIQAGATLAVTGVVFRATTDSTNAGTIRLIENGSQLLTEDGDAAGAETLVNTGTIAIPDVGGAGGRHVAGDLDNRGTVSVAHPEATFQQAAEGRSPTLTNRGSLTVASGGAQRVLDAVLVQDTGGTIEGSGTVNVVNTTARLRLAGGAIESGADVNVVRAVLEGVAGSAATGNVDVAGGESTLSGPVTAGVTVDIDSVPGNRAILRVPGGATNAGRINLNGPDASLWTENGNPADTETLVNTGTISIPDVGGGTSPYLAGDLVNEGTISVARPDATFQSGAENRRPTLTNRGTLTVAAGGAQRVLNAVLVQDTGGTISGSGTVNVVNIDGRLRLAGGAIESGADVNVVHAVLEGVAGSGATGNVDVAGGDSTLSGPVTAGMTVDIDSVPGNAAGLIAPDGATNEGTITLNGPSAVLAAADGDAADAETLTNASTGTIAFPAGGPAGIRQIGGNVLNEGTISAANGDASFQATRESRNPTLINRGTLTVPAALRVLDSTLVQDGGGTISGPGPIDVIGGSPEAVFEVRGGQIASSGDVNVVSSADLSFVSAAGAEGTIDVVSDSSQHTLSGDVPAGISLTIDTSATLAATAPFTNHGRIALLGSSAALRGTTVTNAGTIESVSADGGGRVVGGTLTNEGTVDLESNVAFDGAVTNEETFTVAAGRTASSNAAFTQTAGTTTVDGTLAPATTDVDGGVLQGSGTVQGDLRNAGEVSPGPGVASLAVTGAYAQTAAGRLSVRVDAPARDVLDVGGAASLDGLLAVSTGAAPTEGQTFQVLDAASRTGTFASTTGTSSGPYAVRYDADGVTLVTTSGADLPTLSIDDASVAEGQAGTSTATFAARLSAAATSTVTVDFATANRTARAPGDYAPASGTVTFAPGQVERPVTVTAAGDTAPEPDETFAVALDDAEGARFADAEALGTILNDDLSVSGSSPDEGGDGGSVTLTVHGAGLSAGASVRLSRSGQPDIVAGAVRPAPDGRSLTAVLNLTAAVRGVWDVTVSLPDGRGSATLPGAFTIVETRAADVRVAIAGRTAFRAGRPYEFFLTYSNVGNVDAKGAVVGVAGIPAGTTIEMSPDLLLPTVPENVNATPRRFITTPGGIYVPLVVDVPAGGTPQLVRFRLSPPPDSFELLAFDLEVVEQPSPVGAAGQAVPAAANARRRLPAEDGPAVNEAYNVALGRDGSDNWYTRVVGEGGEGGEPGGSNCVDAAKSRGDAIFESSRHPDSALKGWEIVTVGSTTTLHYMNMIISPDRSRAYVIDTYWRGALIPVTEVGGVYIPDPLSALANPDYTLLLGFMINNENPRYIGGTDATFTPSPGSAQDPGGNFCLLPEVQPAPIRRVTSVDPNDKVGPAGVGEARFISGDPQLSYVVNFENLETASAPAQEVRVTDQLDASKLDLSTFSLGPISFGDEVLSPPAGLKDWVTEVDLRPANDLIVRVEAGLNETTGVVTWRFTSLDPATGLPTDDPLAGFLPPNVNPPDGQGSVLFSVKARAGLPTGTEIRNRASIVFDENAAIETPEWSTTIDVDAPSSEATSVSTGGPSCSDLQVRWSASDLGSGVKRVDVRISDDGGPYQLAHSADAGDAATIRGAAGHTYRIHTVARDAAGNSEAAPGAPDVVQAVAGCPAAPAPAPAQPMPGPAVVSDRVAPTVTARLTRSRFRIGRTRTPAVAAQRRRRAPIGTTFRVTLSEPAAIRIRMSRVTSGVRRGAKCVKRPRKPPKGRRLRRCTRLVVDGTLTRRTAKLGRNDVTFSGRIGRKALARGRHRAEIVATDAAGNRSKPKRLSFTIVR